MEFKLEIDCTTTAFGDQPEQQLAGILRGISNTLEYIGTLSNERKVVTPVSDVNGIQCGRWTLDPKPVAPMTRLERAKTMFKRHKAAGNEAAAEDWNKEILRLSQGK